MFFRQRRAGLNGRPFTIYKFRTMVTNAEQLKHELAAMNEMTGPVFKVTNDPRVTRIGRFLRKFSLDELPQLFNVLRGEMSLVGPRPLPVDEVKRFDDLAHRRRLERQARADLPLANQRPQQGLAISRTGCGWTWNTLTIGRCGWTSKFSGAPCRSCLPARGRK